MRLLALCCLYSILFLGIQGCTTKLPAISHVHIGHATTGWQDTPEKKGLFVIAEDEAKIAAEHAQFAVEDSNDESVMKLHVTHVRHALDPSSEPTGPGLGYGMIKALEGAREHILFASDSKDASQNVKQSAANWAENAGTVLERAELIMALSKDIMSSQSRADTALLTGELQALAEHNLLGKDINRSGKVGDNPEEVGMKQLREQLSEMIAREDPPYQPVERKYLFGLIRLPSGEWTFTDDLKAGGYYGSGK